MAQSHQHPEEVLKNKCVSHLSAYIAINQNSCRPLNDFWTTPQKNKMGCKRLNKIFKKLGVFIAESSWWGYKSGFHHSESWGNCNVPLGARPTPSFRDERLTLKGESLDESSCLVFRRLSIKSAHAQCQSNSLAGEMGEGSLVTSRASHSLNQCWARWPGFELSRGWETLSQTPPGTEPPR